MTKNSGIYKIINTLNGKFYIGSAVHLLRRKSEHLSGLRKNNHRNQRLQNSFNKYGEEYFIFELLEECEIDKLIEREQYYIDTLDPFFNICRIAGNALGVKRSDEFKAKLSKIHKESGYAPTDEVRKLALKVTKGRKLPKETIDKRLETMSNWSEEQKLEHRKKLSDGAKNRSRDSLDRIANGRKKPVIQFTLDNQPIKEWVSAQDAGIELGISKASIGNCCLNKKWSKTAGGFKWKFKDN